MSVYSRATSPHAAQKQAVAELHDVRLVDCRDPLAAVMPRVLEGEPRDPRRRLLRDDLQALDDPGDDFVLESRVEILGVLAHDHQVDVVEAATAPGMLLTGRRFA